MIKLLFFIVTFNLYSFALHADPLQAIPKYNKSECIKILDEVILLSYKIGDLEKGSDYIQYGKRKTQDALYQDFKENCLVEKSK